MRQRQQLLPFLLLTLILGHAGVGEESSVERESFAYVNNERMYAKVAKLQWNDALANAARKHSELMAKKKTLSHVFESEPVMVERIRNAGLRFSDTAENVARSESILEAHNSLMLSQGHRENILNDDYNAVGIGVAYSGGQYYITQDFAHVIPPMSEEQFRAAVVQAIADARRGHALQRFVTVQDHLLKESACSSKGEAGKVATLMMGAKSMLVYSAFEPTFLPESLQKFAGDSDYTMLNVEVCFQPDNLHGNANFWVAIAAG